jgi:lipopolysaccharide/colanic/teichoic acid biosynthesis glycosyltransferase
VIRSVRVVKRGIDVVGSMLGLLLTVPLFPLIAAAIYLDSPGPLFYRQRRAGQLLDTGDGVGPARLRFAEFEMLKFRTMKVGAELATGAILATADDPRITRVGRVLRKTRIDELPQLVNVLAGQMSLVGPRPERRELLTNFALAIPFFEERMRNVKPGITGLAQISLGYSGNALPDTAIAALKDSLTNPFRLEGAEGAQADDMRLKMLFDMAYVAALEGFSSYLKMELSVIAKTPIVMLRGIGT